MKTQPVSQLLVSETLLIDKPVPLKWLHCRGKAWFNGVLSKKTRNLSLGGSDNLGAGMTHMRGRELAMLKGGLVVRGFGF